MSERSNQPAFERSLSLSGLALWLSITSVLVLCFVTVGWWLLFKDMIPSESVAWLMALAVTTLALSVARFLAKKRAIAKLDSDKRYQWYFGWPTYIFLFVLSALGTVNSAFVLWEGPSVVRQDMDEVREGYNNLQNAARRSLAIAQYEDDGARLSGLLVSLKREIDNPNGGNYCGVGPAANNIITEIRRIVPNMPIIRGTGVIRPCDSVKAEAVFAAYQESALAALDSDSAFIAQNGPRRYAFIKKVDENVAKTDKEFENISQKLVGPTSYTKPVVQGGLSTAAARYASDFAELAAFKEAKTDNLKPNIDVSQSLELGSLAAVLQLLYHRLGYISTWGYLFVAILLDFALIYFLTQVFVRMLPVAQHERSEAASTDSYREPGQHPKFLWVNPAKDSEVRIRHV